MSPDAIHQMYADSDAVIKSLRAAGEISLAVAAEATLTKVLVLSAASYFESEIQSLVANFCGHVTKHHPDVCALVQNRVISRQYHTYFDWERTNANKFLAMFGNDFKSEASKEIEGDEKLLIAVRDFMEIGAVRNSLVHLNFASYSMDLTGEEIHGKFCNALAFVEYLHSIFARRIESRQEQAQ